MSKKKTKVTVEITRRDVLTLAGVGGGAPPPPRGRPPPPPPPREAGGLRTL
jgi:hypothetical protein